MKRKMMSLAAVLILALCFVGFAAQSEEPQSCAECAQPSYSVYTDFFEAVDQAFAPDGFTKADALSTEYSSSVFPDNAYFSETDDLYEGDMYQPKNRKLLFFDQEHQSVLMLSFLYSEEHLATRFLTIDEFPVYHVSGELAGLEDFVSELCEIVLQEEHCIILIKAYPLFEDYTEEAVAAYRADEVQFLQSFSDCLSGIQEHQ